ncbi:hypothetical protein ACLOJK_013486 [Asimina triloba]
MEQMVRFEKLQTSTTLARVLMLRVLRGRKQFAIPARDEGDARRRTLIPMHRCSILAVDLRCRTPDNHPVERRKAIRPSTCRCSVEQTISAPSHNFRTDFPFLVYKSSASLLSWTARARRNPKTLRDSCHSEKLDSIRSLCPSSSAEGDGVCRGCPGNVGIADGSFSCSGTRPCSHRFSPTIYASSGVSTAGSISVSEGFSACFSTRCCSFPCNHPANFFAISISRFSSGAFSVISLSNFPFAVRHRDPSRLGRGSCFSSLWGQQQRGCRE